MPKIRNFLAPVFILFISLIFTYAVGKNVPDLGSILGEWMWFYSPRDPGNRLGFVLLVFAFASIVLAAFRYFIDRGVSALKESLLITATVFVLFAVSMSMVPLNKQGLDELPQVIISSERTSFFTDTKNIDEIGVFFREYTDKIDSFNIHSKTHGPLAIIMFWSAVKVMAAIPQLQKIFINSYTHLNIEYLRNLLISSGLPGSNAAITASVFMGLFFPFAACLSAIPLYYMGKYLYDRNTAFMACLIFGVLPNVILFTPQLAQWMLFLGCITSAAFFIGIKRNSMMLIALSSAILSISFMFGFELSFLLIWFIIFLALRAWSAKYRAAEPSKPAENPKRLLMTFAIAGFAVPMLVYLWSGFSIIDLFQKTMSVHKNLGLGIERPYVKWVWADIIEYFAYIGIPVVGLLAAKTVRESKRIFTREFKEADILFVSFIAAFLILDVSGATKGEVARVWLFMAPYFAIFAASAIAEFKSGRKGITTALLLGVVIATFYYTVTLKIVLLPLPLGMG